MVDTELNIDLLIIAKEKGFKIFYYQDYSNEFLWYFTCPDDNRSVLTSNYEILENMLESVLNG